MKLEIPRKDLIKVEERDEKPFLVSKYRLDNNSQKDSIATALEKDSPTFNTAKELNGHPYIGNINWNQAMKLAFLYGAPLTLKDHQLYREILDQGRKEERGVYDGGGNIVNSKECKQLYDELMGQRDHWRGEYLDAYFESGENNILYLLSDHRLRERILRPQRREELDPSTYRKDGFVDIPSFTKQGLPTKLESGKQRNLYYFHPQDRSVARLRANSGMVYLDCYCDEQKSDSGLGVRAKILIEEQSHFKKD